MNPFTVLLLIPDYATSNFGLDHYLTQVHADSAAQAVEAARTKFDDEGGRRGDFRYGHDLAPIAVFAGHHESLNPE